MYYVYCVRCNDNSLYTGHTGNIERRMIQHRTGKGGSKYIKSRGFQALVYTEKYDTRSEAIKREKKIKTYSKKKKEELVSQTKNPFSY